MDVEIVLDTETTGLDPKDGHRIVEIGAIKLRNKVPTDERFQVYIHPERSVPAGAADVHGLTDDFLRDKPKFRDVAQAFIDFIQGGTLVIHNAPFDVGFLDYELNTHGYESLSAYTHTCIDTLKIARQKFPGSPASLDALCKRFGISNQHRDLHGALVDCELLAHVFLELSGGRQTHFLGAPAEEQDLYAALDTSAMADKPLTRTPRQRPSADEEAAHDALIAKLSDPVWETYSVKRGDDQADTPDTQS